VEFWSYLRDEERFETPEALAGAIAEDVRRTRAIVSDEAGDSDEA
jgi:FAD synthase